ncbi:MAG: AraC family transcriptional regulator ligand-binding domain-containing protein [Nocardioidaceae bacterium]|nr:AraC family transcriptional regulator ligand-binding domain-containing protein [Nocardioidaceae bacterium]
MKPVDMDRPLVPVGYGRLIQDVARAHGVGEELLAAAGLGADRLGGTGERLSATEAGTLLLCALELTGEPALGYEIGLHSSLTSHGLIGLALMSVDSIRAAAEWGAKYSRLRLPMLTLDLVVDGDWAALQASATTPLGPVRQCTFDLFLVGLARIGPFLTAEAMTLGDLELWFEGPEPGYYRRYRDRLPAVRFDQGVNQVRFPERFLEARPVTADPEAAALLEGQFRAELEELGLSGDPASWVRALVQSSPGTGLVEVAAALALSPRTLKRHLAGHGTTFTAIADDVRRREGLRLLRTTTASVEQIAARLGYADPSNFVRAFRRWTGRTPGSYRRSGE